MKGKWGEISLNALRIIAGFLLMPHGAQKMFGVLGREAVALGSLPGVASVLELFGGFLVLIGLYTRPTAFVLSGLMAVAYWMAHGTQAFLPIVNRGELAALYCFVFLFLWGNGGGDFSVDGWLRKRR